ncbi:MAG: EAL domain-containing protein [Pseudomonadota bacterium]
MNRKSEDRQTLDKAFTDVRSEQVRILFAATPSSLATILASSLGLSIVLWPAIDHSIIISWFVIINLLSVVRLQFYFKLRRLDKQRAIPHIWYQLAVATGVSSGLTWGAGGYLLFAENSLVHQMFLGFVVAGMCAGAVTTLAAIINSARAFIILALLPVVIQFYRVDNEISVPMALMSMLFLGMILISAKRLNTTVAESLSVRRQREVAEHRIRHQAHYDELTDLPNRRLLLTTLRQEMAKAERHRRFGALFFIDLDRFKSINDSLGHSVGDDLLIEVARILKKRLRREDTAARLGGDEFVVLLPEVGDDMESAKTHAASIANEIRKLFSRSLSIQGHDIHLTISVGIALFPADVNAEDLLKFADVAMYQAKRDGRDGVRVFSTDMQEAVNQQRIIERGLRTALSENQFELYFQAQFDDQQKVVGAETLLRWNHPEKGVVGPALFIDIAEQSGLIVPIGEWVLQSACRHLAEMDSSLMLSVNVSPRQFSEQDFIDHLKQLLLETGADSRKLKLEITEGLAMANIEHTVETMKQLKQLGVSFSIDDFGTGYSSLNYLHQLPVDELKIDQSFVRNISSTSDHTVIVDTIIIMAQQLNLDTVAEGVETDDEFQFLMQRKCNRFQGYFFARPQPFEQFKTLATSP